MYKKCGILEKTIAQLMQRTGLRGALMIGTLFLTDDFKRSANNNSLRAITNTFLSALHHQDVHDLTTAVNMIDDRVDSSPPDWILKIGKPHLGIAPSSFLTSEETCPKEFTHAFNKAVHSGLTQRDVGNAFNNILAYELFKRAKCDENFRANPSLENRQALHDANMRISEVYTIFIFRCLTKSKTVPANIEYLNYADAVNHMPEIAHISGILQIFDDVRDVLIDMEAEIQKGVPTSNWLVLKMSENGDYTTKHSDKDAIVTNYVERLSQQQEVDMTPPQFIKAALKRTEHEVSAMIADVEKPITRTILSIILDVVLNSGLRSSSNPDVIEKQKRREAEFLALKLKYA